MRRQATIGAGIVFTALITAILFARSETRVVGQSTQPERGAGMLMGVIVDALTGQQVANAEVTLDGAPTVRYTVRQLTDSDGHFVFFDLPKGIYRISATKAGYAEGAYGRRRPAGLTQSLILADGERVGELRIPIWKYGAVTGTIRDEAGEPMIDVAVRVLQPTIVAGKKKLSPFAFARTDDRGVYRVGALTVGEYVVAVPSTQASAPQSVIDLYEQFRGSSSGPASSDLYRDISQIGGIGAMELLVRPGGTRVGDLAFQSLSGNQRSAI